VRLYAFAIGAGLLLTAASVLANGRFPRAQRLLEQGGDPDKLVLAATYGLVVTSNRGAEWRHVCELSYAFSLDEIDPIVGVATDGALLVTGSRSLNRAVPPWCEFSPVLGGEATHQVTDFSFDPTDPDHLIAILMQSVDGGLSNQLYESSDGGRTFLPLGVPLPTNVAFALTLDAAPSDPERLYVTATDRQGRALLARSDDRGRSWNTTAIPAEIGELSFIGAVDPSNPNLLYVRIDRWRLNDEGLTEGNDGLVYSSDGGGSWHEIHRAAGKIFGFALAPDGTELLIGYGDPVEPARLVDPAALGIYRASAAGGYAFTKIFDGPVSCLSWTMTGVYACASQQVHGFALGFAAAADFDLTTAQPFTPLLRLPEVAGALECPACSRGAICGERWLDNCAVFGACDAGAAGSGGSAGASCPDAGMAGQFGLGGAAGGDGSAGKPGSGGTSSSDGGSDCGCRIAGAQRGSESGALLCLTLASFVRRRRVRGDARRDRAKSGW
jgi:hypothetical protein